MTSLGYINNLYRSGVASFTGFVSPMHSLIVASLHCWLVAVMLERSKVFVGVQVFSGYEVLYQEFRLRARIHSHWI
jgi:hypothetical protein